MAVVDVSAAFLNSTFWKFFVRVGSGRGYCEDATRHAGARPEDLYSSMVNIVQSDPIHQRHVGRNPVPAIEQFGQGLARHAKAPPPSPIA